MPLSGNTDLISSWLSNSSLDTGGSKLKQNPAGRGQTLDSLVDLMRDRNVQSLMAGVGQAMDPEGPGGYLGKPVQNAIQSQGMAEAHEKQSQQMKQLIDALGGRPGSIKVDRDGNISASVKESESKEASTESGLKKPEDDLLKSMSSQYQSFFEKMFGNI